MATRTESIVFGTRHVPNFATTSRSNASAEIVTASVLLRSHRFAMISATDAMISPVRRMRSVSATSPIHAIVVSTVTEEILGA